jgi:hypothetical protein
VKIWQKEVAGTFFVIFEKWLGVFLEVFQKPLIFSEFSWTAA